jgi:hypothetical protein
MMRLSSILTTLVILWPGTLGAEGKSRLPVTIHGFVMGNASIRTTGERPPLGEGGAFVLGEERLRLDVSGASGSGSLFLLVKGDVFHDAIANRVDGDLREAYAGWGCATTAVDAARAGGEYRGGPSFLPAVGWV